MQEEQNLQQQQRDLRLVLAGIRCKTNQLIEVVAQAETLSVLSCDAPMASGVEQQYQQEGTTEAKLPPFQWSLECGVAELQGQYGAVALAPPPGLGTPSGSTSGMPPMIFDQRTAVAWENLGQVNIVLQLLLPPPPPPCFRCDPCRASLR